MELLVSVTLGAVLLVALVNTTGLYTRQVGRVMDTVDRSLEETLALVGGAVEQAWVVDPVSNTRIDVYDALGTATTYALDGSTLRVTRPSGASGVLLEGVAAVTFSVATQERLREATPLSLDGTVWEREVEDVVPASLPILGGATYTEEELPYYDPEGVPGLLRSGDALAIGFRLPTAAADAQVVDGVTELMQAASFDRLTLPLGLLEELPSPPFSLDAEVALGEEQPGVTRVTLCHIPLTSPDSAHRIEISSSAVPAHLAHGDTLSACPPDPGQLTVEIYAARGPDDARPYGPLLGSVTFEADGLPSTEARFEGIDEDDGVVGYEDEAALVLEPPDEAVSLDLAAAGLDLSPGVPYTVVIRYEGSGIVTFSSSESEDAMPGIATCMSGETGFGAAALDVEAAIGGAYAVTQTTRHDVVNRVTTTLVMADGRRLASSALLATQMAVSDPWSGGVPGEFPLLELRGQ